MLRYILLPFSIPFLFNEKYQRLVKFYFFLRLNLYMISSKSCSIWMASTFVILIDKSQTSRSALFPMATHPSIQTGQSKLQSDILEQIYQEEIIMVLKKTIKLHFHYGLGRGFHLDSEYCILKEDVKFLNCTRSI